jgi:hypothetical protein
MKESVLIIAMLMSFSQVYAQDWTDSEISQFIQGLNNGFEVDYSDPGWCLTRNVTDFTDLSGMTDRRKCNGDHIYTISSLELHAKDNITNCHFMVMSVDDLPLPAQIKLTINSQVSILPSNDSYFVRLSEGSDYDPKAPGGGNKLPKESSLLMNFLVKKGTNVSQCMEEVYNKYILKATGDSFAGLSQDQKTNLHLVDICYLHSIYASSGTETVDSRALEKEIDNAMSSNSPLGPVLINHWSVIRNNALNPPTITADPPVASLQTAFSEVYGAGSYMFLDEFERIFEIKRDNEKPEVKLEIVPLNEKQYGYQSIKDPAHVRFVGPLLDKYLWSKCPSVNDESRGSTKDIGTGATDSSSSSGSTAVKE